MSEQTSERETLISELARCARVDRFGYTKPLTSQAAEMLRADAAEIAALRQRVEACEKQLGEARATIEALRKDVVRMNYLETRVRKYDGQFFRGIGHELPGFLLTSSSLRVHIDATLAHSTPAPVNEDQPR